MQTDLGGSVSETGSDSGSDSGIVAAYSYAARYIYSEVVVQNDNFLQLTAATDAYQSPITTSVLTRPASGMVSFQNAFGNSVHRSRVTAPHQELTILSIGVVRFELPGGYPSEVALAPVSDDWVLEEFLTATPLVHPDQLADKAREIVGPTPGLLEAVEGITGWVYRNIQYVKQSTTVSTTAEEVLRSGVGVCQDMAHVAMGMLKSLGIPSRYVCGLLTTEVGETHAWLEFWHPLQGWIPSDPTRGHPVARCGDLLKFSVGRDYTEAAPVSGSFVSRGAGWLDAAAAQVQIGRDSITFDDAQGLIEILPP